MYSPYFLIIKDFILYAGNEKHANKLLISYEATKFSHIIYFRLTRNYQYEPAPKMDWARAKEEREEESWKCVQFSSVYRILVLHFIAMSQFQTKFSRLALPRKCVRWRLATVSSFLEFCLFWFDYWNCHPIYCNIKTTLGLKMIEWWSQGHSYTF